MTVWQGRFRDWEDQAIDIVLIVAIGLLLVFVARWAIHRITERIAKGSPAGAVLDRLPIPPIDPAEKLRGERLAQRSRAVGQVLRSVATVAILATMAILVLDVLRVPVAPFIASAGLIGVAIGFGAQTLVRDFISGLFMMIEDQYGVGDVVDMGDATGTVEAVGLRVTRIRDIEGTVWYFRNGEIKRVANKSQGFARAVIDVPFDHDVDLNAARGALIAAAASVADDPDWQPFVTAQPEVWGVQTLTEKGLTIRLVVQTVPLEQWKVARELRARIMDQLAAANISLPQERSVSMRFGDSADAPPSARQDTPDGTTRTSPHPGSPGQPERRATSSASKPASGEKNALTSAIPTTPPRSAPVSIDERPTS